MEATNTFCIFVSRKIIFLRFSFDLLQRRTPTGPYDVCVSGKWQLDSDNTIFLERKLLSSSGFHLTKQISVFLRCSLLNFIWSHSPSGTRYTNGPDKTLYECSFLVRSTYVVKLTGRSKVKAVTSHFDKKDSKQIICGCLMYSPRLPFNSLLNT